MPASNSDSTPGAILQPQPPPCDKEVRRGGVWRSGEPGMERLRWGGRTAVLRTLCTLRQKNKWRKAAGVEPTWERLTPPTGFEAQPCHRTRMPSAIAVMIAVAKTPRYRHASHVCRAGGGYTPHGRRIRVSGSRACGPGRWHHETARRSPRRRRPGPEPVRPAARSGRDDRTGRAPPDTAGRYAPVCAASRARGLRAVETYWPGRAPRVDRRRLRKWRATAVAPGRL